MSVSERFSFEIQPASSSVADSVSENSMIDGTFYLRSQVRMLSDKLARAVDKIADLEDELLQYRPQSANSITSKKQSESTTGLHSTNRISAFLSGRRSSFQGLNFNRVSQPGSSLAVSKPQSPSPEEMLEFERNARIEAETRLAAVTTELEELSQSLFEEANSMVSSERKARSRVEERLREMEAREEEKKIRLGELEQAVGRIGRVREMLDIRPSTAQ